MKPCYDCGHDEIADASDSVTFTFPGDAGAEARVFRVPARGYMCRGCKSFAVDGKSLQQAELAVAFALTKLGIRTGKEAKFVRKAAGIRAAELGDALDVTATTVSNWETGVSQMSGAVRLVIAEIAQRVLLGEEKGQLLRAARARVSPGPANGEEIPLSLSDLPKQRAS